MKISTAIIIVATITILAFFYVTWDKNQEPPVSIPLPVSKYEKPIWLECGEGEVIDDYCKCNARMPMLIDGVWLCKTPKG